MVVLIELKAVFNHERVRLCVGLGSGLKVSIEVGLDISVMLKIVYWQN